jgi:hypothetical protein
VVKKYRCSTLLQDKDKNEKLWMMPKARREVLASFLMDYVFDVFSQNEVYHISKKVFSTSKVR